MKKLGISSILVFSAFFVALAFSPLNASADTVGLKLTSTGSQTGDGGYVYPYNFTVTNDGYSYSTSLMCISYHDEVWIGESWTATVYTVAQADAAAHNDDYEIAAWLFNDAATKSANTVADQEAAWYLFEPDHSGGDSNGNNSQLQAAINFVNANPNSGIYSEYDIYVPVDGSQPRGDGTPQTFIGGVPDPPAATPEPGSLLLLGTGLLGFAAFSYRKARAVAVASHSARV